MASAAPKSLAQGQVLINLTAMICTAHALHRAPVIRPRVIMSAASNGVPANDPRGVTGRFSVFAPNVTETVSVCEFRAELKKNLGAFRDRGTSEERHARYQASSHYLDALTGPAPERGEQAAAVNDPANDDQ